MNAANPYRVKKESNQMKNGDSVHCGLVPVGARRSILLSESIATECVDKVGVVVMDSFGEEECRLVPCSAWERAGSRSVGTTTWRKDIMSTTTARKASVKGWILLTQQRYRDCGGKHGHFSKNATSKLRDVT